MRDKTAYNRKYHKKWYANPENAARQKANARMHTEANRRRNLQFIEDYKREHPCPCGESHPACLDFHHADSRTKQAVVSDLARHAVSLATLSAEIQKCIVLCRNCHAKLHYEQRNRIPTAFLDDWLGRDVATDPVDEPWPESQQTVEETHSPSARLFRE